MAAPGPPPAENAEEPSPPKEGLSALAAKVLDQLSLTSWLPAALLTAGLAVLFQFRSKEAIDLPQAVAQIGAEPFQLLVVMVPLLVIATMITQAFSFSAIRTLEGYWNRGWLSNVFSSIMTKCQARKKLRLEAAKTRHERRAFATSREQMLSRGIPATIVCALEAKLYGQPRGVPLTEAEALDMEAMSWEEYCSPWQISKLDQLQGATPPYPRTSRILPTALGNRLRATEDNLENTNGDLEGFVLSRWAAMPIHLRLQHDEFRDRLEMYCILVFVAAILSVATILILFDSKIQFWQIGLLATGFLALACVCYSAAITSANGYCTVLKQIDKI
ncbi:hypothetical protein [Arthrobacter sp. H16F315]|uniref:hypothetical protein n=1 Tax=Arthrobacter sp. H16F315 TaxID=2955314 RepID=UPI0020983D7D|nr:hypothetical protein [Arthrobacter sp. H16F315]MDD1477894.1 hypothetical protein [Arthrobacter sp. H16F315]